MAGIRLLILNICHFILAFMFMFMFCGLHGIMLNLLQTKQQLPSLLLSVLQEYVFSISLIPSSYFPIQALTFQTTKS